MKPEYEALTMLERQSRSIVSHTVLRCRIC